MDMTLATPANRLARNARRSVAAVAIGTASYLAFGAGLGLLQMPGSQSEATDLVSSMFLAVGLAVVGPFQTSAGDWFGPGFFLIFTGVLVAWIALAGIAFALPVRGLGARERIVGTVIGLPLVAAIAGAVIRASGLLR